MIHKKIVWFAILITLACAGIIVLSVKEKSIERIEKPVEKVIYFLPHQDDEMVLLGSIFQNLEQGKDVYTVMVTDGGKSIIHDTVNGVAFCTYHDQYHNPDEEGYYELSREDFVRARNDEYFRAMQSIGVSEDHILFANPGGKEGSTELTYRDSELTQAQALEVIQTFYHILGDGTYITLASEAIESDYPHSDHIAIERALKEFNGIQTKLFFADRENPAFVIELSGDAQKAKARALQEYTVWKPEEGKFMIGGHSILDRLKLWGESKREYMIGN